jgi:diguanylate cyclase (GGDEF)-like protein
MVSPQGSALQFPREKPIEYWMTVSAGSGSSEDSQRVWFRRYWLFAVGAILLLCLAAFSGIRHWDFFHRPLVRVAYNRFPPYVDVGPHGVPVGFAVETLTQAARRARVDIRWVEIPGSAEDAFFAGKADLYPLMTVTPERQSQLHMSPPWWENQFALISTSGAEIQDAAAANGKAIATRAGIIKTLSLRLFPGARFVEMTTLQEMEAALCAKRTDGFLSDVRLLQTQLLQRTAGCEGQALYALSVPDSRLALGTASTKAAASANDRIFREIAKLALDGTLSRTAAAWGIFAPFDTARLKQVVDAEANETILTRVLIATLFVLTLSLIQTNMVRRSKRVAESAQADAKEMQDRFNEFMKHTPTITFIKDEQGQVIYSNEEFWCDRESVGNGGPAGWAERSIDEIGRQLILRDEEVLKLGVGVEVTEMLHNRDGTTRHFLVLKFPFRGAAGKRFLRGVALDVTAKVLAKKELEHYAKSDPLTGLPNRRNFMESLETALQKGLHNERIAVGFADLDGFKLVNDLMGHDVGDDLLKQVAARLKQVCGETDMVARLGGDEFTFFLTEVFPGAIQQITRSMQSALEEPFWFGGREIVISASIGVSLFPDHGATSAQLLHNADSAMYVAKRNGRGRIQHYSRVPGVEQKSGGEEIVRTDVGFCFGLLAQPDG